MTPSELRRLQAVHELANGTSTQGAVAAQLGLCLRQVKRLYRNFRLVGAHGLVSKQRGRPGNRRRDPALVARAVAIVRTSYSDFGPTLASEKLRENHDIALDRETLRQALIAAKIWKAKRRRCAYHPVRERRPRFGELVQIDGSPHAWFEERGPRCTLLVFIDDATSRLVGLRFSKGETTAAYFALAQEYFTRIGLPQAFYCDRYSVFRINSQTSCREQTQFGRAMDELDIALICAHSPQAKGRVERANRTLQDRLVKELRLAGISSIEAANAFVPSYIEQHNRRFAVAPQDRYDAHRRPPDMQRLDAVLVAKWQRKLSKDMTFQYGQALYEVLPIPRRVAFPHALVELIAHADAPFHLQRNGIGLPYRLLKRLEKKPPVASGKDLSNQPLWRDMPQMRRPPLPKSHPWKKPFKPRPILSQGDISNLQDGDI